MEQLGGLSGILDGHFNAVAADQAEALSLRRSSGQPHYMLAHMCTESARLLFWFARLLATVESKLGSLA